MNEQTLLDFSSFIEILRYRARHQSSQIAYRFLPNGETESSCLTYETLDRQARAIATQLQSMVVKGERVLLIYSGGIEFIAAFFGCLYSGVVAVPVASSGRDNKLLRLKAIVADASPKVALTTTSALANLESFLVENSALSTLRWLTTDTLSDDLASDWQEPIVSRDNLAFLQYTSGSTGTPKAVMVSHGNLLYNSALIYQSFEHNANSQGVIWLPPHHDMGLIGGILQPLYGGFPVILMPPMAFLQKPFRWLQAISRYRATTSGGPNFAYELCRQKISPEQIASLDLSCWDVAFIGSEPVRWSTLKEFSTIFKVCGFCQEAFYPCYGMAETTLIVSGGKKKEPPIVQWVEKGVLERNQVKVVATELEESQAYVGCGQSLSGQAVVVVDPHTFLRCSANQVGEIWVFGPSVAQGYWHQIEKTKETFQAHLADTGDGPFLRTGDLGFLENGELFITGRLKDVIIIRGQNYYPQDIELTVYQSHPALETNGGAAFTVEIKGEERLVIVQEVKRSYLKKLDTKDVVRKIRQAITTQYGLQVYATVLIRTGTLPKTSSGKIQHHACREKFLTKTLQIVGGM